MARTQAQDNQHGTTNKHGNKQGTANKQCDQYGTVNKPDNKAGINNISGSNRNEAKQPAKQSALHHAYMKGSPHQTTHGQSKNSQGGHPNIIAQVYRAATVLAHPDVGFESGAWLFDSTAAPQWLQSQLPSTTTGRTQRLGQNQAAITTSQKQPKSTTMQSHLCRPDTKRAGNSNAQVYRAPTINAHPDVGFESGAWLFDRSAAPQWLESQLPLNIYSSYQNKNKGVQKQSPYGHVHMHPNPLHAAAQSNHIHASSKSKPTASNNNPTTTYTNTQMKNPSQKNNAGTPGSKQKDTQQDVGFESGAWLFDPSSAPLWLTAQLPKTNESANKVHNDHRTKSCSPQHRRDDLNITDHAKPCTIRSNQTQSSKFIPNCQPMMAHPRTMNNTKSQEWPEANDWPHVSSESSNGHKKQSSKFIPNCQPMMANQRTMKNTKSQEWPEANDWPHVSSEPSTGKKQRNRVASKPTGNTRISNHTITSNVDLDWVDWPSAINHSSIHN